ncbi:hypothetical protein FVE85_3682 [Porphyridium purpureum]|uniref:Uncharacterized protein n=1 Tax=Porphyridium purpureum TaxID=35688 RepID=A0A5J4YNJ1_PORPP|nr:hypothetical protein FVE85_3682 [Porphyridium purpureum]|eukprot:POR6782..scf249_10
MAASRGKSRHAGQRKKDGLNRRQQRRSSSVAMPLGCAASGASAGTNADAQAKGQGQNEDMQEDEEKGSDVVPPAMVGVAVEADASIADAHNDGRGRAGSAWKLLDAEVLRTIAGHLCARDRFQLALADRFSFGSVWPRRPRERSGQSATLSNAQGADVDDLALQDRDEDSVANPAFLAYDTVAAFAEFHDSVRVSNVGHVPHCVEVSGNGHVIVALCQEEGVYKRESSVLLVWHVPTRSILRTPLEGSSVPGELMLMCSDDGRRLVILHARENAVYLAHLVHAPERGDMQVRIRRIALQGCAKNKISHTTLAVLSLCGNYCAVYNARTYTVYIFAVAQDHFYELSSWNVGDETGNSVLVDLKFGPQPRESSDRGEQLLLLFHDGYGTFYRYLIYDWRMAQRCLALDIESHCRISAVSASWEYLVFRDFKDAHRHSHSAYRGQIRSALCHVSLTAPSSSTPLEMSKVAHDTDNVKMRRYVALQKQTSAVLEPDTRRSFLSLTNGYAPIERAAASRALVGLVSVDNKWKLKLTVHEHQAMTAESASTMLLPVHESRNALLEDNACIRFSRDARWMAFVRADQDHELERASRRGIVISIQNMILI